MHTAIQLYTGNASFTCFLMRSEAQLLELSEGQAELDVNKLKTTVSASDWIRVDSHAL
jgi:hypothetical protein